MARGPFLGPPALDEEVLVGLALGAEGKAHGPPDDGAGEAAFGAVAVEAEPPVAPFETAQELDFRPECADVAVFADKGGVEAGKAVAAAAPEELGAGTESDGAEPLVPAQGRVDGAERAAPETDRAAPLVGQFRHGRVQVDGGP